MIIDKLLDYYRYIYVYNQKNIDTLTPKFNIITSFDKEYYANAYKICKVFNS